MYEPDATHQHLARLGRYRRLLPNPLLAQDRHGAEVELSADADDDRALPQVG
jgi:hypothetical protein